MYGMSSCYSDELLLEVARRVKRGDFIITKRNKMKPTISAGFMVAC